MTYEMSLLEIIGLLLSGYVIRMSVEEIRDWRKGGRPE